MLHHVDDALGSWLRLALPPEVDVLVAPPTRDWALTVPGTVVNLFPHRIQEDVDVRAASWSDELDGQGRVIARALPPRRYRFCYLLTVWAGDGNGEHEVLGTLLAAMARVDRLPCDGLPVVGTVALDVAHPHLPGVTADLWTALGIPPRSHLDVVVTATLAAGSATPLHAPPSEVSLGVVGEGPPKPDPRPAVAKPARRIRE
jgi:hypothetical protein